MKTFATHCFSPKLKILLNDKSDGSDQSLHLRDKTKCLNGRTHFVSIPLDIISEIPSQYFPELNSLCECTGLRLLMHLYIH